MNASFAMSKSVWKSRCAKATAEGTFDCDQFLTKKQQKLNQWKNSQKPKKIADNYDFEDREDLLVRDVFIANMSDIENYSH